MCEFGPEEVVPPYRPLGSYLAGPDLAGSSPGGSSVDLRESDRSRRVGHTIGGEQLPTGGSRGGTQVMKAFHGVEAENSNI